MDKASNPSIAAWQSSEVEQALAEADAGDFASEADLEAVVAKYACA
jgi:predicted transcriptional regulator